MGNKYSRDNHYVSKIPNEWLKYIVTEMTNGFEKAQDNFAVVAPFPISKLPTPSPKILLKYFISRGPQVERCAHFAKHMGKRFFFEYLLYAIECSRKQKAFKSRDRAAKGAKKTKSVPTAEKEN
uniref:Uncharacterized protein n=1 Tax=Panagrolaimus sp. ES5 TaxID=591445 RepID=A0AC34G0N1_9BILA